MRANYNLSSTRCAPSHRTDERSTLSGSQQKALGQSSTRLFLWWNTSHYISSMAAIRVLLKYLFSTRVDRRVSSKLACSLRHETSIAQGHTFSCCLSASGKELHECWVDLGTGGIRFDANLSLSLSSPSSLHVVAPSLSGLAGPNRHEAGSHRHSIAVVQRHV